MIRATYDNRSAAARADRHVGVVIGLAPAEIARLSQGEPISELVMLSVSGSKIRVTIYNADLQSAGDALSVVIPAGPYDLKTEK